MVPDSPPAAPRRPRSYMVPALGAAGLALVLAALPAAPFAVSDGFGDGSGAGSRVDSRQPELFAAGALSTADDETGIAFTPDGRTAYFGLRSPTTTTPPVRVICVSRWRDGRWSEPEVAPFSGLWHDSSPALAPDGSELFFASDRPVPDLPARPSRTHLWVMRREATGWGPPRSLPPPVLSADGEEDSPSVAADGTLYFASDRPGGQGGYDLYRALRRQGRYAAVENLAAVNSPAWELAPAIAPDQSLLVFAAAGRPDGMSGGGARYVRADLYVSRRGGDGGWTVPRSLGPPIDSAADEGSPSLSPDGRWLYFASERSPFTVPMERRLTARDFAAGMAGLANGRGNLYRVAASVVRQIAAEPAAGAAAPDGGAEPYASIGPAPEPKLLAEGVVSTPLDEFGGQLVDGGRTLFFSRSVPRSYLYAIFVSRFAAGRWQEPEVAPFSGIWRDYDPVLSADGSRLFFISDRPRSGATSHGYNIWFLQRTAAGGWSEPRDLGEPIDGVGDAHFASTALDGTLYFTSHRPGNLGYVDVYRARRAGDGYAKPENLGPAINGPEWSNLEAFVSPEGDRLFVAAFGHRDGLGDADLFVSFLENGVWSPLQSLGPKINSPARDYTPRLTPDGRYFLFSSERGLADARRSRPFTYRELERAMHGTRNGLGNLYVVDASVLPRRPAKSGGG